MAPPAQPKRDEVILSWRDAIRMRVSRRAAATKVRLEDSQRCISSSRRLLDALAAQRADGEPGNRQT